MTSVTVSHPRRLEISVGSRFHTVWSPLQIRENNLAMFQARQRSLYIRQVGPQAGSFMLVFRGHQTKLPVPDMRLMKTITLIYQPVLLGPVRLPSAGSAHHQRLRFIRHALSGEAKFFVQDASRS